MKRGLKGIWVCYKAYENDKKEVKNAFVQYIVLHTFSVLSEDDKNLSYNAAWILTKNTLNRQFSLSFSYEDKHEL